MIKIVLPFLLILCCFKILNAQIAPILHDNAYDTAYVFENSPIGFASVNANGQNGTNGGAGGDTLVFNNADSLQAYMTSRADPHGTLNLPPKVIVIQGTILPTASTTGQISIKNTYNLTIIGKGTNALFDGLGLAICNVKNIIVRNIELRNCKPDCITINTTSTYSTHHVWVDHCTFSDSPEIDTTAKTHDGLLDITHRTSYVTVSWCRFNNHRKTCLLGFTDGASDEQGQLLTTYHHNWFEDTFSRHPRVRHTNCHVYNNYYNGTPNIYNQMNYGIASTDSARVLVEGCYFKNVINPTKTQEGSSPNGNLLERNNIFSGCGTVFLSGIAFDPLTYYNYNMTPTDSVPSIVMQYAGNGKITIGAPPVLPSVSTSSITNITLTTAIGGGNITSDGGATITTRGICWSTLVNPVISDSHTSDGTGTGIFTSMLTGLSAATTYHVRAYASNVAGTNYGSDSVFTTLASPILPVVSTSAISAITTTGATCGGIISSDGGASVIARGVCFSTSANPTISDNHTSDGTGTGSFISSLTGLSIATNYHIRAYATNSTGTGYGADSSFSTLTTATVPVISTNPVSGITFTTASSGGTITSDGGAAIITRGVCWGTTLNPTITNSHTSDGTGTGMYVSSITGLSSLTTYHVRAYATNSIGTSYGSDLTFTTTSGGQSASCVWALTSNQSFTTSGYVNGTNQILSSGGGILSMFVKDYTAGGTGGGQRCNLGSTTSWPTETQQNDGRFEQYDISPQTGYNFTATLVNFDCGYSTTSTNMHANVYYSTDNWLTRKKLNSSDIIVGNSAWNSPAPSYSINVFVGSGSTFSVRIYPWYISTPAITKYLSMRNFSISGNTFSSVGYVNVSLIPQGFYDITNNRLNSRDTFKIFLANVAVPYEMVDSAKVIIDSLTFNGQASFRNADNGIYYIVVKHRNSIETWSRNGGESFQKGVIQNYNFSDSIGKAYENNLIKIGTQYCIFSGDVNQDGTIDISDMVLIDNDSFNFSSGYLSTDINGDGSVDISDMVFVDNNSFNFVGVQRPVAK